MRAFRVLSISATIGAFACARPIDVANPSAAGACTFVAFAGSPSRSAVSGSTVRMTVAATCSSDQTPLYRFSVKPPGGDWKIVRDFTPSGTFEWDTTGLPRGSYGIKADVHRAESATSIETFTTMAFEVVPSLPRAIAGPSRAAYPDTSSMRPRDAIQRETDPVESGDRQTAYLDQALSPVILRALDSDGNPIANAAVTVTAPPGAVANADSTTTDADGRVTLHLVLGLRPGDYAFHATIAGYGEVVVHATAIEPPPGTIFSLTNAAHAFGDGPVSGAGTAMTLMHPVGVAIDTDGTIYFSDQGQCRVYALSVEGEVRHVAGSGEKVSFSWGGYTPAACGPNEPSCAGSGGRGDVRCVHNSDSQPAIATGITEPTGLALDPVRHRLYISEMAEVGPGNIVSYVRFVDLDTGLIHTYAGGGEPPTGYTWTNDWPTAGTSAPPLEAKLSNAFDLVLGPDRSLYIQDGRHNRIMRVDPEGKLIYWYAGAAAYWSGLAYGLDELYYVDFPFRTYGGYLGVFSSVRFDSGGTPYLAGEFEILRLGADGLPTYHSIAIGRGTAGNFSIVLGGAADDRTLGLTMDDGVPANQQVVSWRASHSMAFDRADNLFFGDHEGHVIRRIDHGTGLVWTVAGDRTYGFNGDYIPAISARVNQPAIMAFTPTGHLVFADSGNGSLRVIW
jgi:carboxypeptidase family protein/Big-like domain-containing protein